MNLCLLTEGKNTPYSQADESAHFAPFGAACNAQCHCGTFFEPVCDVANRRQFITPCHAGCTNTTGDGIVGHSIQCNFN